MRSARLSAATAVALGTIVGSAGSGSATPAPGGTGRPALAAAAYILTGRVVGAAATPDAAGFWVVASDGGVFTAGDARFAGSLAATALNQPVVGIAATPDGQGYWLVASDGGVFAFGDARFAGSLAATPLNQPIVGIAATPDGQGYWLVASDGGVFAFGDAVFGGSAEGRLSGASAVALLRAGSRYWVTDTDGRATAFAGPPAPQLPEPILSEVGPGPVQRLAPGQDPAYSIPPSAAQRASCWGLSAETRACDDRALADIDAARASEGLGPLVLPPDFYQLGQPAQLVAVTNSERTSRGLPPLREDPLLDALAQAAATAGTDPVGPRGYLWDSNIAWGTGPALSADFGWMYDDGPGSGDVGCTVPGGATCWAHRHNVLAPWPGAAGAGVFLNGATLQLTQLLVKGY